MPCVKCNDENLLWGPIQGSRGEGAASGSSKQGAGSQDEEEKVSTRGRGDAHDLGTDLPSGMSQREKRN